MSLKPTLSAIPFFMVLACLPRAGGADAGAGPVVTRYILSYSGPASVWRIDRGTQRLAPKNGLALELADCITLAASATASARMTLVVDGNEVAVTRDAPHFCVAAPHSTNPVLAAIGRSFASLASVFHDAESDYNTQSTTSAVSRGPLEAHLNIPMLAAGDQRLTAGRRAPAFAWAAGSPPYSVTLSKAGESQALASGTATVAHIRLPDVTLTPGTYVLTVSDAAKLSGEKRFTVVPEGALPPASADVAAVLADPATSADLRAAFAAASLMNDPSDAWRLEAYQRVVGHDGSELARRLIYQLEHDG